MKQEILNIEFKAHNPPIDHIKKDVEKLLKEDVPGCWNHLLKNVDTNTIPSLFEKFKKSISELINEKNQSEILFSICIIEKKSQYKN